MIEAVTSRSQGLGCDAVIITAASKSDEPVNLAVALSRQKARIVVVGVADIHPTRNELWAKEVEIMGSIFRSPMYDGRKAAMSKNSCGWLQKVSST